MLRRMYNHVYSSADFLVLPTFVDMKSDIYITSFIDGLFSCRWTRLSLCPANLTGIKNPCRHSADAAVCQQVDANRLIFIEKTVMSSQRTCLLLRKTVNGPVQRASLFTVCWSLTSPVDSDLKRDKSRGYADRVPGRCQLQKCYLTRTFI